MPLNTTRWRPDTCACIIEYAHDTDLDPDGHDLVVTSISPCPAHSMLSRASPITRVHDMSGPEAAMAVKRENHAKNRALALAQGSTPRLRRGSGPNADSLPDDVEYAWSFTGTGAARTLQVEFRGAGLSGPEKATIRAAIVAGKLPLDVTVV